MVIRKAEDRDIAGMTSVFALAVTVRYQVSLSPFALCVSNIDIQKTDLNTETVRVLLQTHLVTAAT